MSIAARMKGMAQRQGSRWKVLLLLMAILGGLLFHVYANWDAIEDGWKKIWHYEIPLASARHFHERIRPADRIVVRDGGYNCCGEVDQNPVLFTVTNRAEIEDVYRQIQFISFTNALAGGCMCCGYPGIDWYKGRRRLALTSIQHGFGIRWKEFGTSYSGPFRSYGDIPLTLESSLWLIDWMRGHGVTNGDYAEKRRAALSAYIVKMHTESGSVSRVSADSR